MRLSGRRFLLLEDEPIIAMELEDMLLDLGADVVVTSRLEEAFAALADDDFNGAILDINIQGERSYPLASALRERGVRFVFTSGYGASTHPPEFRDAMTVTKPYTSRDIERALAQIA